MMGINVNNAVQFKGIYKRLKAVTDHSSLDALSQNHGQGFPEP